MRRSFVLLACFLSVMLPVDATVASTFNTFNVEITEFKYDPRRVNAVAPGDHVVWTNNGEKTHTATGKTNLGAWDSGDITPGGGSYEEIFETAGSFAYFCTIHKRKPKMHGSVKVDTIVFPFSGMEATMFTITWAAGMIPAGFNVDVQIKRPGSRKFKSFLDDQTGAMMSTMFTPDAGPGEYKFRSRLQNDTTGGKSGFSPQGVITVTG